MKKLEAIIRPEKLNAIKDALVDIGITAMTVTNVSGRGRQRGITLQWRAGEYRVDFLPKLKIEIFLSDDECQKAVDCICNVARTGRQGDGVIFILPVDNVYRVRTNNSSERCISTE
jgi:nitrogen regulatory protein P-II 1